MKLKNRQGPTAVALAIVAIAVATGMLYTTALPYVTARSDNSAAKNEVNGPFSQRRVQAGGTPFYATASVPSGWKAYDTAEEENAGSATYKRGKSSTAIAIISPVEEADSRAALEEINVTPSKRADEIFRIRDQQEKTVDGSFCTRASLKIVKTIEVKGAIISYTFEISCTKDGEAYTGLMIGGFNEKGGATLIIMGTAKDRDTPAETDVLKQIENTLEIAQ